MKIDYKALRRNPHAYAQSLKQADHLSVLRRLDHLYYAEDAPKVDNSIYDVVKDSFAEKYPKHSYLNKVAVKGKGEVPLPFPMGSLRKVKPNTKAIEKFIEESNSSFCLTDKLDGISLEVIYDKGKPVQAFTRGDDGLQGKDVSRHIPLLNIPKQIAYKKLLPLRAEAIVSEKRFNAKLSLDSGGEYKTARNAVGGLINQSNTPKLFKHVDIVFFRVLGGELANKRQSLQLKKLDSLGFTVVKSKVVKSITSESLSEYYSLRKKKSKFEIDGIVVERNEVNKLVAGYPPYAKAFKENLETDMVDVKIQDVIWQDSRTGTLAPVGIIKPTMIGGVQVERVSLHNYFTVVNGFSYKDRKLGLPVRPIGRGAVVRMVRSGQVIPHVVTVLKAAKKPTLPKTEFKVKGVQAVASKNSDDSKIRAIVHFFSTLKVEGLKDGTVRKLFLDGYDSVESICAMTPKDWRRTSVGEAAALKLPTEIKKKVYSADIVLLAHASNIFMGIGETRFAAVFDAYPDIVHQSKTKSSDFICKLIMQLPSFGSTLSKTLAANMLDFSKFLSRLGIKPKAQEQVKVTGAKLKDTVVCFTGVRNDALKKWIVANGGKVAGSFTKQVNLVIKKDDSFTSSSVDKAEDNDIPVFTIDAFTKKYKVKL